MAQQGQERVVLVDWARYFCLMMWRLALTRDGFKELTTLGTDRIVQSAYLVKNSPCESVDSDINLTKAKSGAGSNEFMPSGVISPTPVWKVR
jgi:hypothetical protein